MVEFDSWWMGTRRWGRNDCESWEVWTEEWMISVLFVSCQGWGQYSLPFGEATRVEVPFLSTWSETPSMNC